MKTVRVMMLLLLSTVCLLNTVLANNDYHFFTDTVRTGQKETLPGTSLMKQQQLQRMLVTFDPEMKGLIGEHFWIDLG